MNLHKDVLDAVYHYQLNELLELAKNGENVSPDKIIETLINGLQSTHLAFVDMSMECRKYMETILQMQKDLSRERRIVQLFLQNHKLEYEYENFEARILERIFHPKK